VRRLRLLLLPRCCCDHCRAQLVLCPNPSTSPSTSPGTGTTSSSSASSAAASRHREALRQALGPQQHEPAPHKAAPVSHSKADAQRQVVRGRRVRQQPAPGAAAAAAAASALALPLLVARVCACLCVCGPALAAVLLAG
jgi:hypothetical protein